MKPLLLEVRNLLLRLADAAPSAWRQDRAFRWAAIGAGIFLLILLTRGHAPHDAGLFSRPLFAPGSVPTLTGAGTPAANLAVPIAPTPTIAPGQALGPAPVTAPGHGTDDGDSFGTVPSGKHP